MRVSSLMASAAAHVGALAVLSAASVTLFKPAARDDLTTIHVSLASLPSGRAATPAPPAAVELPPQPAPEPKDVAKPHEPAKSVPAPKKPKVRTPPPVKPVTKAQAAATAPAAASTPSEAPAPDASDPATGSPAPLQADSAAAMVPAAPDGFAGPGAEAVGGAGSVMALGEAGAGDSYLGLVQSKVGRRWQPSAASAGGRDFASATVSFRIDAGGNVEEPVIVTSSGLSVFDREALRAVSGASPLPPPPARFRAAGLNILFTFTYHP